MISPKLLLAMCLAIPSVALIFSGGQDTGAIPPSILLDVPYHVQLDSGYAGEASLEMVFDFWGEDINQREIRNVTGTVVDSSEPEDLVRAAHFSYESRARLNPTQSGYPERSFGFGYAAFQYNWGRDGMDTSPRFDQRFSDLKNILAEGYPVILLMRESVNNPVKRTYRVLVGYDSSGFILHDPLPEGTGELGGEAVKVDIQQFDELWNSTGGARWGMIAAPWQMDVDFPLKVDAGETFEVICTVLYPCPNPFPENQYPVSGSYRYEVNSTGDFTLLSSSAEGLPQVGGETGEVTFTLRAPERGLGDIFTLQVGIGGEISVRNGLGQTYTDMIGGSVSIELTVEGYVNHPPEIRDARVVPDEVLRDGESEITLYCTAADPDGDLAGVEVDLSRLGGYAHQNLYDDGSHGDETPYDGIYTFTYTVPRGAEEGNISLTFTAYDARGESAVATAYVVVKDPYTSTHPPEIISAGFTPSKAPPDGYTDVRVWARVTDPDGDVEMVYADLSELGGKRVTPLRDDGSGGDLIRNDGNYTYLFTVPVTVPYGTYNVTITAEDAVGHETETTASLVVAPPPEPPRISQAKLNRSSAPNDGRTPVLLTAIVKDSNGDLKEVYADLSQVGGGTAERMYDDGTHGDKSAGDKVYSLSFTVSKNTPEGSRTITVTATDREGLEDTAAVTLRVISANTPPEITTYSVPPSLPAGGRGRVEVSVTDPDGDLQRVYLNLSSLKENLTLELRDDGAGADKTASDGIWSGYLTVPEGVEPGEYTCYVVAVDSYGESIELPFTLEVKEAEKTGGLAPSLFIWLALAFISVILAFSVLRGSRKKSAEGVPPAPQNPPAFVPVSTESSPPVFQPVR